MTNRSLIIDTPNQFFYNNHRGEDQINKNLFALIRLISSDIHVFATLTPKMYKYNPQIVSNLDNMIKSKGGKTVPVWEKDPDIVVLELSKKLKFPILTNDKFKQNIYKLYSGIDFIRFDVIKSKIVPRNRNWNEYIYGKNSY